MNFKSFLAKNALTTTHKFTKTTFRESLNGISTRISQNDFDLIKDDYIKSIAEATNYPAHYIRAEWVDEETIKVTYAIVDEAAGQQLQATLAGDTHHQDVQDKVKENGITSHEVTSIGDHVDHDIPGKPYVMLRDMDSNVNIMSKHNYHEHLNPNLFIAIFTRYVPKWRPGWH